MARSAPLRLGSLIGATDPPSVSCPTVAVVVAALR